MFNSLLEDVLLPLRAVCCHNVFDITTHQNLLLPALSIHCVLSQRRHTLILANNTFYYWTLPHALCNQIYFLSGMSAQRHMSRHQRRYERVLWSWGDKWRTLSLCEGDPICVCCASPNQLTFGWWHRLANFLQKYVRRYHKHPAFDLKVSQR